MQIRNIKLNIPSCLKFIFILAIILTAFSVFKTGKAAAADFYVRPEGGNYGTENGTSYENAWDGLENLRWGTGGVQAGDTLFICGTHVRTATSNSYIGSQGRIIPGASGNEQNPIIISGGCTKDPGVIWGAYKDERPDSMTDAGWTEVSSGIFYNETRTWNKAFEWFGLFENINGTDYQKYSKLGSLSEVLSSSSGGVYYIEAFGSNQHKIWARPFQPETFRENIRWSGVAGWKIVLSPNHSYIEFRDLKIYAGVIDHEVASATVGPYHHYTFKNLVLYSFHQYYAYAPWNSHDITIDECEFAYSGNGFYAIWNRGPIEHITIKNSYFHDIGRQNIPGENPDGHGIGVQNNQYYYILGNRFERCGSAVDFHVGATDIQKHIYIERNFAYDMRKAFGYGFAGNGFGFEGDNDNPEEFTSDMHISNNIVADCEGTGIPTTRKPNVDIFNNTVSRCARSYGVVGNRIDGASATFNNNISFYPTDDHFYFNQNFTGINFDFTGDNNIYFPKADQAGAFYYLNTNQGAISNLNATFSEWKAAHASYGDIVDGNSLVSDPFFANLSGSYSQATDFRLQPTSPAIDAGTDVGLTTDFDGHLIVGAPDIGAYEFQPGSDTISPESPSGITVR